MPRYAVLIPMAGHIEVTVNADSEDEAIDKAFDTDFDITSVTDWDVLRQFNKGNTCYCPSPWEAEATEIED